MASFYESGRTFISPPPSDWEVSQDRPEEVEGIEQCLPGEDGHPSDDYQGLKRLVVDRFNSRAHFIEPNQTPTDKQANPDNRSWRATLYSTNGLKVDKRMGDQMFRQPLGVCRQEDEVYVYESHPVLSAACPQPNLLQPFPKQLSTEEIIEMGERVGSPSQLFCVSTPDVQHENKRTLFLKADSEGAARRLEALADEIDPRRDMWWPWSYFADSPGSIAERLVAGIDEMTAPFQSGRSPWLKTFVQGLIQVVIGGAIGFATFWAIGKGQRKDSREMMEESADRAERFQREMADRMEGKDKDDKPVLSLGTDLTERARNGKLSDVQEMDPYVDALHKVLLKRTMANPLLLGPAGTGKSALFKAFVLRALNDPRYANTRFVLMTATDIKAGMKYYGQIEERMKKLLQEIREAHEQRGERIVLIMDEFHALFLDEHGRVIKPNWFEDWKGPLQDAEWLKLVAATTDDEYEPVAQSNPALGSRLTPIRLREKTETETLNIMRSRAAAFKGETNIEVKEEALQKIIELTRYEEGHFPRKAVDGVLEGLLQEARTEAGRTEITADHVVQYYARIRSMSVDDVVRMLETRSRMKQAEEARKVAAETQSVASYLTERESALRAGGLMQDAGEVRDAILTEWRGLSQGLRDFFLTTERNGRDHPPAAIPKAFIEEVLHRRYGINLSGANGTGNGAGSGAPTNGAEAAPEAAAGPGNGAHTNGEVPVTLDHILLELEDRFEAFRNPHLRLAAIDLARGILVDYERNGRPQSSNGSAIPGLPPEELIDAHVERFVRLAESRRDPIGRDVAGSNRGRRVERGKNDLARRIFEHFQRAAEEASRRAAP